MNANDEVQAVPVRTGVDLAENTRDKLRKWVLAHGVSAGAVRARAYLLVKESRANLLVKGTIVLTDGSEKDLGLLRGNLLQNVIAKGAQAAPVTITGLKSKLKEIDDFWLPNLDPVADPPIRLKKIEKIAAGRRTDRAVAHAAPEFIVYAIRNTVTGRMYFGSTNDVHERWATHRRELRTLTHKNVMMRADAREHGAGSFKFFVVWRVATRAEMLRREQLLLAMYFNRDACYNMRPSVDEKVTLRPVNIIVFDRQGGFSEHTFLTLHAAIRHYRLCKALVREAISRGHGRVGHFQFPVTVPITQYRVKLTGRALLKALKPEPRRSVPKEDTYYNRLKNILDTQKVTFAQLGKALSASETTMSLWNRLRSPTVPQQSLLRLIEKFGLEWVLATPSHVISTEALVSLCGRLDVGWVGLEHIVGLYPGRASGIALNSYRVEKLEALLLSILIHHGPNVFPCPSEAELMLVDGASRRRGLGQVTVG
jgi:predicted GIY-YIG superfamily endonuclease